MVLGFFFFISGFLVNLLQVTIPSLEFDNKKFAWDLTLTLMGYIDDFDGIQRSCICIVLNVLTPLTDSNPFPKRN